MNSGIDKWKERLMELMDRYIIMVEIIVKCVLNVNFNYIKC